MGEDRRHRRHRVIAVIGSPGTTIYGRDPKNHCHQCVISVISGKVFAVSPDDGDDPISFNRLLTRRELRAGAHRDYTEKTSLQWFIRRAVFSSSDPSRAQRALKSATETLFSVLFPSNCRICRSPLTNVSALPVCGTCLQKIVPLEGILCSACGEKLPGRYFERDGGACCGLCHRVPPPFQKAVSYGAYDGALRELIHLFKYQHVRPSAPLLGRLLDHAIAGMPLPERLLVVPVPLSRARQRDRGFNQAEQIARNFVHCRPRTGIQLSNSALVRTRETASQTGLTRHQRRSNLRGAFAVTHPEMVRERNILVVDDVMTTGTTASECARVLLRAGANQVFVATVARATKEVEGLLGSADPHRGGTLGHA